MPEARKCSTGRTFSDVNDLCLSLPWPYLEDEAMAFLLAHFPVVRCTGESFLLLFFLLCPNFILVEQAMSLRSSSDALLLVSAFTCKSHRSGLLEVTEILYCRLHVLIVTHTIFPTSSLSRSCVNADAASSLPLIYRSVHGASWVALHLITPSFSFFCEIEAYHKSIGKSIDRAWCLFPVACSCKSVPISLKKKTETRNKRERRRTDSFLLMRWFNILSIVSWPDRCNPKEQDCGFRNAASIFLSVCIVSEMNVRAGSLLFLKEAPTFVL